MRDGIWLGGDHGARGSGLGGSGRLGSSGSVWDPSGSEFLMVPEGQWCRLLGVVQLGGLGRYEKI